MTRKFQVNGEPGALVDQLADVRQTLTRAQELEAVLKDELIETGLSVIEGRHFTAIITKIERKVLDDRAIRQELGDAWADSRSKISRFASVKVVPRELDEEVTEQFVHPFFERMNGY